MNRAASRETRNRLLESPRRRQRFYSKLGEIPGSSCENIGFSFQEDTRVNDENVRPMTGMIQNVCTCCFVCSLWLTSTQQQLFSPPQTQATPSASNPPPTINARSAAQRARRQREAAERAALKDLSMMNGVTPAQSHPTDANSMVCVRTTSTIHHR